MRTIVKSPAFRNLFDSNNFFTSPFGYDFETNVNKFVPAVNVTDNETNFVLEFMAPGYTKEDLKVNLEENTLTVSAEHQTEENETKDNYVRKEFTKQSFSRSFLLPENIDENGLQAKYENGVINVAIPKKVKAKVEAKKEIKIE